MSEQRGGWSDDAGWEQARPGHGAPVGPAQAGAPPVSDEQRRAQIQAVARVSLRNALRRLGGLLAALGGAGLAGAIAMTFAGEQLSSEPGDAAGMLWTLAGVAAAGIVLVLLGRERPGDRETHDAARRSPDPAVRAAAGSDWRGRMNARLGAILLAVLGVLNTLAGLAGIPALLGLIPAIRDAAPNMLVGLVVGPCLLGGAWLMRRFGMDGPTNPHD